MPVAELDRLEPLIDLCPLQLRPGLRKRWQGLRRRARAAKPVDRGLRDLARDLEAASARRASRLAALPSPEYVLDLPVVARRAELRAAIAAHPVIIVCGETGSGKTTQLP
ncbi:MAG: hypothetical protein OQK27_04065, partial [Gammaproteobacteria bacterium]|nr:hypothetical protein [Gammaproteobacteria bacterium]